MLFSYTDLRNRGGPQNASLVEDANKSKLLSGHLCLSTAICTATAHILGAHQSKKQLEALLQMQRPSRVTLHLGSSYWQQKSSADASSASTLRLASITNTC